MFVSAQKFNTGNSGIQNSSLVFFRQIKGFSHPDKKMAKKLSEEFRQVAIEFLRALFAENDIKKAKIQANKLLATVPQDFYPLTVDFLGESFAKARPDAAISRFLPDVRLLKMFNQLKSNSKKSSKSTIEKMISLSLTLGKKQTSFVLDSLPYICGSQELFNQMQSFAVFALQQAFSSRLNNASTQAEIVDACWYARKAISINRQSTEKIEIICEEFSTSLALKRIGIEPDEARALFVANIPDLQFFSSLHLYFWNARERIGKALMFFKTKEAQEIAKEALAKAQEIKSKVLACDFQMLCLESCLYEALFIKGDLKEAIEQTKEIVNLAQQNNLPVPTFVSEAFFTFAYSKLSLPSTPCSVRKEVLRAIPSFVSNQLKEMELLEIQMQKTADRILLQGYGHLKDILASAYRIAELSFLAPPRVFVQKRKNIINIVEGLAMRYEAAYGKEIARRDGLSLEQVRAELSAQLPDIYSFK
ncbi:MAG: hypothetical protein QXN37_03570 [Candidatus Anstonellaceae archaeon]